MVNGFNIYGFIHNTNLDKKITTLAKQKNKKKKKRIKRRQNSTSSSIQFKLFCISANLYIL